MSKKKYSERDMNIARSQVDSILYNFVMSDLQGKLDESSLEVIKSSFNKFLCAQMISTGMY